MTSTGERTTTIIRTFTPSQSGVDFVKSNEPTIPLKLGTLVTEASATSLWESAVSNVGCCSGVGAKLYPLRSKNSPTSPAQTLGTKRSRQVSSQNVRVKNFKAVEPPIMVAVEACK